MLPVFLRHFANGLMWRAKEIINGGSQMDFIDELLQTDVPSFYLVSERHSVLLTFLLSVSPPGLASLSITLRYLIFMNAERKILTLIFEILLFLLRET